MKIFLVNIQKLYRIQSFSSSSDSLLIDIGVGSSYFADKKREKLLRNALIFYALAVTCVTFSCFMKNTVSSSCLTGPTMFHKQGSSN